MKRSNNIKKGFTLAELLVVVAIIAVLVAISIPVFTSQLHKARVATDWASLRALYAEIQTEYITNSDSYAFLKNYSVDSTGKIITKDDGTTITLQAGIVHFDKPTDSSDTYYFFYVCDNGETSHQLFIRNDGIETYD